MKIELPTFWSSFCRRLINLSMFTFSLMTKNAENWKESLFLRKIIPGFLLKKSEKITRPPMPSAAPFRKACIFTTLRFASWKHMPYGYRGLKIFTSLSLRFQYFQHWSLPQAHIWCYEEIASDVYKLIERWWQPLKYVVGNCL